MHSEVIKFTVIFTVDVRPIIKRSMCKLVTDNITTISNANSRSIMREFRKACLCISDRKIAGDMRSIKPRVVPAL